VTINAGNMTETRLIHTTKSVEKNIPYDIAETLAIFQ
jgi:hypothetical protein